MFKDTMKNTVATRLCAIKYIFITLIFFCFFLSLTNYENLRTYFSLDLQISVNLSNISAIGSSWLIDTSGCQILNVDPMHRIIQPYIKKRDPYLCPTNISDGLIYVVERKLFINATVQNLVIKHYNRSDSRSFKCCTRCVNRFAEETDTFAYREDAKCVKLKNGTTLTKDLTKVECSIGDTVIYRNFEMAFVRKKDVESRCQTAREYSISTGTVCEDQLSVLIIGLDSVSRLNFHRNLPKSYKFLMEQMKGIEFLGYNKLGLNTFPSLMPLLNGHSVPEMIKGCWGGVKYTFDKCIFLMDLFANAGFRTAFIEDEINIGLFTYLKKGFKRQFSDYVSYTYFSALNSARSAKCSKNTPDDQLIVKWAVDFQQEYQTDPHFGFFWTCRFTHDYLNDAQLMDPILLDGLQQLNNGSILNNTLLIIMTDHGLRYGDIFKTQFGSYELNLPFMTLIFPEWFRQKYSNIYRNVQYNAENRLVTLFDLHQTLLDILHCNLKEHKVKNEKNGKNSKVSLFGKIPPSRTCVDAEIPHSYCSCFKHEDKVDVNSTVVTTLASLVIDYLNNATSKHSQCAELKLKSITKAFVEFPGVESNFIDDGIYYYRLNIVTQPGNGAFQSFILYECCNQDYKVDSVERISQYGNSSYCVNIKELKPICYCT